MLERASIIMTSSRRRLGRDMMDGGSAVGGELYLCDECGEDGALGSSDGWK